MSSDEDLKFQRQVKRKRMRGACDLCRQKKIRCDSGKRPGKRCTNCVGSESECTHVFLSKKIGPAYRSSREGLSRSSGPLSLAQLRESMDPLLKTILQLTYQAPTNAAVVRETLVNLARYARALETAVPVESFDPQGLVGTPQPSQPPSPRGKLGSLKSENMESLRDLGPTSACEPIANLKSSPPSEEQFLRPSSIVSLPKELAVNKNDCELPSREDVSKCMRPHVWSVLPREVPTPPIFQPYHFPEPDLMTDLINLYFAYTHNYSPFLHRPTFEKSVFSGLHLTDPRFGGTVLIVCALASRYSNDRRILLDGTNSLHSSGYKWFRQVRHFNEASQRAPVLYDLQTLCLSSMYLQGTSPPEQSSYFIGLGIRAAQDIGINRTNKRGTRPTVEGELHKRVFWALLLKESAISAVMGRSPSIHCADLNCDLPLICDDEYWENPDPELAFKQPLGKPSKVAFFNTYLGLMHIQSSAHRCFYSVNQPSPPAGTPSEACDRATLADIDNALNSWLDRVPEHLCWDDQPDDPIFFNQSAILYTAFYYTQILVHRPFVVNKDSSSPATPSLIICTSAAQSCIRIVETQAEKGFGPLPQSQISLFGAGLTLLLSIWNQVDMALLLREDSNELSAVVSCIEFTKLYEDRWPFAGRFSETLMALLDAKGVVLPSISTEDLKVGSRHLASSSIRRPDSNLAGMPSQGSPAHTPPGYPPDPVNYLGHPFHRYDQVNNGLVQHFDGTPRSGASSLYEQHPTQQVFNDQQEQQVPTYQPFPGKIEPSSNDTMMDAGFQYTRANDGSILTASMLAEVAYGRYQ